MASPFAVQFYNSKPWKDLRRRLIIERGGKCERCGSLENREIPLIGHHRVELTEGNVGDAAISLNPDVIEIICLNCHNREHRRFGVQKKVYIIWGSPLSGKSTYVSQIMRRGDLVIDIDSLWQAVSGQARYVKPKELNQNIFALRDCLYEQVRMRMGMWVDCYIIAGLPGKTERDDLARRLGAETVYVESTMEECLARAEGRPPQWKEYVLEWWRRYIPPALP